MFELFSASDGFVDLKIFPHPVSFSMQLNSPMTYTAIGYNYVTHTIHVYICVCTPTGTNGL